MKEPTLFKQLYNLEKQLNPSYDFDLKAFEGFLAELGSPQNGMGRIIHIAGTNGKGSVAHILSSILKEAGYKVGLYTSPHITHVNERIRIGNIPVSDYTFRKYERIVFDAIAKKEKSYRTFFEAMTAQAFLIFRDNQTDFAILETGLGGRLDSTNVVMPEVSVITKIGMDHMHILGSTIEDIAKEKCGIIKEGKPVFSLYNSKSVMNILQRIAKEKHAPVHMPESPIHTENGSFSYRGRKYNIRQAGAYQTENAALCIDIAHYLKIDERSIVRGIEHFSIEGRMQKVLDAPIVYIDGSHNAQAIEQTMTELREMYPKKDIVVIAAFMQDKDFESSVNILRGYSKELVLTTIPFFRAAKREHYKHLDNVTYKRNVRSAYNYVYDKYRHNALILFIGSFYLLQHAIKAVNK